MPPLPETTTLHGIKRPVVLILTGTYLPGFKAGGPVRTLVNLVDRLGNDFDFRILTADRDLGDKRPYDNLPTGKWVQQGKARVMYLPPAQQHVLRWRDLLNTLDFDLLYLNSFFSSFTRKTLFWRRWGDLPNRPVILAPRGEFSPGALGLKSSKKRLYLNTVGYLGFYRNLVWQASSPVDVPRIQEICLRFHLDENPTIHLAPNLPAQSSIPEATFSVQKQKGTANLVFLARISRMKNLAFALQRLAEITGQVQFDIYGPMEDKAYWRSCQDIIARLPANIRVSYQGEVRPQEVSDVFARYHAFLFPTLGENFGHVILESLAAGCPVITSDRTPWRDLAQNRAGWDLPLEQPDAFRRALQQIIDMNQTEWLVWSKGARKVAEGFIHDPAIIEANRQLFLTALS